MTLPSNEKCIPDRVLILFFDSFPFLYPVKREIGTLGSYRFFMMMIASIIGLGERSEHVISFGFLNAETTTAVNVLVIVE